MTNDCMQIMIMDTFSQHFSLFTVQQTVQFNYDRFSIAIDTILKSLLS